MLSHRAFPEHATLPPLTQYLLPTLPRLNLTQKIVVTRSRKPHIADPLPVYADVVEVPQAHIGHIFRDIFLNFAEKFPPFFPIALGSSIFHEDVERCVAVASAVGSCRRYLF